MRITVTQLHNSLEQLLSCCWSALILFMLASNHSLVPLEITSWLDPSLPLIGMLCSVVYASGVRPLRIEGHFVFALS